MEHCFRVCPKCGQTKAKFYVKEEPQSDVPYYLVVFICENSECKNEWEEPIYEQRILDKIKSTGYRKGYENEAVKWRDFHAQQEKERRFRQKARMNIRRSLEKGLSPFELERGVKLRIRRLGGTLSLKQQPNAKNIIKEEHRLIRKNCELKKRYGSCKNCIKSFGLCPLEQSIMRQG